MKPCAEDPNKTKFTWLLNIDLKVYDCVFFPHSDHTDLQEPSSIMSPSLTPSLSLSVSCAGLDPEDNHKQSALSDAGGLCQPPQAKDG